MSSATTEQPSCMTKAALEREIGRKLTARMSNRTKVAVLEFLLMRPLEDIQAYITNRSLPTFFTTMAKIVAEGNMQDFMTILRSCRDMVHEDKERESFR